METKLSLAVQYEHEAPQLTRARIRSWVQKTLKAVYKDRNKPVSAALTIRLTDNEESKSLNSTYRQKNYATNVLTFAYGTAPDNITYADIVICVPILQHEANEQGKPFMHHAAHLVIHGTLHALGYDHSESTEAEHMEGIEVSILSTLGIPNPYSIHKP